MPSLFAKYKSPKFAPQITDAEWDAITRGIRANRVSVEEELVGIALQFLSTQPGFAALVPMLSRSLNIQPNLKLDDIFKLLENLQL